MSYEDKAKEILRDGSTSYWMKEAIRSLHKRDVVDVLNELECLQELFMLRFEEAKAAWEADKAKGAA